MRPHPIRPALVVLVLVLVMSGCSEGKGSRPTRRGLSSVGDFGGVSFARKHVGSGIADGMELLQRMVGRT
jgi:hypothetical protein